MSHDSPKPTELVYQRLAQAEAKVHAAWLVQTRYPVRYSDARGQWQNVVLEKPEDLAALDVPSGQVYIPLPDGQAAPAGKAPSKPAYDYEEPFTKALTQIKALTPKQRFEHLKATAEQLSRLRTENLKPEVQVKTIVEASQSAFLVNKTLFMDEVMTPDRLEVYLGVKAETRDIVRRVTDHIGSHAPAEFLLDLLQYLSSGSTISHVNRVFAQSVGLFFFYNEFFEAKGWAGVMRRNFAREYGNYYAKLLPEASGLTFDRVYPKAGLISDVLMQDCALGTLLHDIGKVPQIDYFESSEGYDREKVVNHAFAGFDILRKTYEKTRAVAHMAGDHHEYYGHKDGYGIVRRFYEPAAAREGIKPQHCLTLELSEVENRETLAFVPAKLLELVDVFDALTDPERKYRARSTYTAAEALELMRREFLDNHLKLDPLLFDIFCLFLQAERVLGDVSKFLVFKGIKAL